MGAFHDKYSTLHVVASSAPASSLTRRLASASPTGPYFAIGEIGNGMTTTMAERLAWLKDMTSAETKAKMPQYIACSWFNVNRFLFPLLSISPR
jgi:hypothetical protein